FVPISHGVRVSTAILSYNGRIYFGITGDYETASDVDVLALAASAGISSLLDRVVIRQRDTPGRAGGESDYTRPTRDS
ncbi:MAG TPA: hypothetical protein VLZ77_11460, partial [Acidimicrobiales bacterium]|nr:hypothetical protein [Acidimicrobiales bacterium]